VSGTVESGDHYSPSSRSSRAPGLPLGARNPRVAGAWLRLQAPSCCAVGGGGGSGSGTAAGAVMDAQQQLDLVMRHQSMATVCESEVQARLSLPPSLSLCSSVPRWQDSTFFVPCSDWCVGRCPGFARGCLVVVVDAGRAGVVGVGSREAGAPARQEEPRRRGAQPLREGGCRVRGRSLSLPPRSFPPLDS
jgi:hypothetical protein